MRIRDCLSLLPYLRLDDIVKVTSESPAETQNLKVSSLDFSQMFYSGFQLYREMGEVKLVWG